MSLAKLLLRSLLLVGSATAAETLTNTLWRLDRSTAADLKIEGAVTLGVPLDGADQRDSMARGGDGIAARFDGGIARVQLPPKIAMGKSGLTWSIRVKPSGTMLDGGLFIASGLPLNVELAAWYMPWGSRWNLGYFQSTPGRVAHAAMNEKQDKGWLDIVVRVHPPTFQPPRPSSATYVGWTEIFVNGQLRVRRPYTGPNAGFGPSPVSGLVIGRDRNDRRFHGLMDHLTCWARALSDDEIASLCGVAAVDTRLPAETPLWGWHQEIGACILPPDMPRAERLRWIRDQTAPVAESLQKADPSRPRYHLSPPGFIYNTHLFHHQGVWHMFPTAAMGGSGFINNEQLMWMHLSSSDLLNWLPHDGLMAEREFDPNGAFFHDAQNRVNVVAGGFGPFVEQAVATDAMLEKWSILPQKPTPKGGLRGRHDPAVFRHNGRWYLAATSIDRKRPTSQIHLYRSEDGSDWEYAGLMHESEVGVGTQECLVAFMLADDILVLSANKALTPGSTYIVGRFKDETFTLLGSGVSDYGHSAQSGEKRPYNMVHGSQTPVGRTLVWQWQGQIAHPRDITAKGWSSCYSLPREITLRPDHTLAFQPATEVEKLRGDTRVLPAGQEGSGLEIPGEAELRLVFNATSGNQHGWHIGPPGGGITILHDAEQRKINVTVDAAIAHQAYDGPFSAPCAPAADGTVTLRLFLDRSMVELYTPEGNVISTWAFFKEPGRHLLTTNSPATQTTHISSTLWPMSPLTWSQAKP